MTGADGSITIIVDDAHYEAAKARREAAAPERQDPENFYGDDLVGFIGEVVCLEYFRNNGPRVKVGGRSAPWDFAFLQRVLDIKTAKYKQPIVAGHCCPVPASKWARGNRIVTHYLLCAYNPEQSWVRIFGVVDHRLVPQGHYCLKGEAFDDGPNTVVSCNRDCWFVPFDNALPWHEWRAVVEAR